ncbi:hypothetical protein F441_10823 [Phytophthora nicotianae CJ01A1]|uniref:Uncharacterized protein n=4 Tax=Phytophthora nicotianae TaxID=4792 RepID=V9F252_PHYNI|nr:hypothetical protein F443_10896 [Phytophthora nicotianae P1569]ETK84392.1 hypothetical protein L915_10633 [Phytophthora nicotianae]ETP14233.1 hypothetical protein F441_10823 [Phytophthora nicotianae CJ01A1]ETP42279.1 hypothetical protein F442_10799 [Phytophthora nicotianae P10297]ETL37833.1 hypothetical protein L916_10523 [Phytophthora nicotianae]
MGTRSSFSTRVAPTQSSNAEIRLNGSASKVRRPRTNCAEQE